MANEIDLDLDPKKVLTAMQDMVIQTKKLAADIEEALGKKAPKSIGDLETAAEKGTNKISKFFQNLGTKIKEDLKTAFATSEIMGGMKFAKDLGEGVKQVFDLERAFDRLNTRLGLSKVQMDSFKKSLGQKVAGTGQKLEDILPGVETAAARGGVKNAAQLSAIGEALGQVKATTGEGVEGVTESVIEILKTQGQKVTAESFKKTLDAVQGTRVSGAFKTAGDAAQAIEAVSPFAQKLGLDSRQLGGLAATASKSGSSGQEILRQLMEKGTQIGGQEQLNAIFGQNLFKNGKLDPSALGKINVNKFGKFSQQIMEETTGLKGASGADLKRFVESFQSGMGDFSKVVNGANETSSQFATATDNLASKIDEFKEKTKEAGRELGESVSKMARDLMGGQVKKSFEELKNFGKTAWENKGTLAAGLGTTAVVGALMGGGLNHLFKKVGGNLLGGVVGDTVSEAAAEAAGVQKVYVVNASEIGGGAGEHGETKIGGKIGQAVAVAGVGIAAYEATKHVTQGTFLGGAGENGGLGGWLYDKLHPDSIKKAMVEGANQARGRVVYSNPSDVKGRGGSM